MILYDCLIMLLNLVDRLTHEAELFGTASADDRWPLGGNGAA